MKESFISTNFAQTRKLGKILAEELRGGEIVCLMGELGSGKTTFAQGILKGLEVKGPYTSPTFVVMKQYRLKITAKSSKLLNVYHIDAYRVGAKDILDLGWDEIVSSKNNIVIVEWAERIKNIIPKNAVWLEFEHLKDDMRKIVFSLKHKTKR